MKHTYTISQCVIKFLREMVVFISILIISTMLLLGLTGCKSSKTVTQQTQTQSQQIKLDSVRKFTLDTSMVVLNKFLIDSIDINFTIKADSIKIKDCVIYNTVIKKNTRKKTESTEKYIESKTELNITDSIAQIKTDSISEINIKSKTTAPSNSFYKIFIYSFLIFVLFIFIFIIRWLRKHNIL